MEQSVVAVFDNRNDAQSALEALLAEGFKSANARITSAESSGGSVTTSHDAGSREGDSLGDKIARFFGFDDEYQETYSEAMRRGHYVLQVDASDSKEVTRAQDIIYRFNPANIDKKSTGKAAGRPALPEVQGACLLLVSRLSLPARPRFQ